MVRKSAKLRKTKGWLKGLLARHGLSLGKLISHPALPGIVSIYTHCTGILINGASFQAHECSGLVNKLCGGFIFDSPFPKS